MNRTNREHLKVIAQARGELNNKVVFLGRVVPDLYATNPAAPDPRPTMDVDCIVEVQSRRGYYQLEEVLREKGFTNDQIDGAPVCRWIIQGLRVDAMPVEPDILGFSNEWHKDGLKHILQVVKKDRLAKVIEVVEFCHIDNEQATRYYCATVCTDLAPKQESASRRGYFSAPPPMTHRLPPEYKLSIC